jgi:hypothetical protein
MFIRQLNETSDQLQTKARKGKKLQTKLLHKIQKVNKVTHTFNLGS